jgi:hypothetical protein
VYYSLIRTSLSGYALLNASLTAVNDFDVRELPCSPLHSFCATGVSSGLATRVTLNRVSYGRLGESVIRGVNPPMILFFTVGRSYMIVVGLRFE